MDGLKEGVMFTLVSLDIAETLLGWVQIWAIGGRKKI